jgi:membrane protein
MFLHLWAFCDRWLWSRHAERDQPAGPLLRLLRFPYAILRDLSRGQINLRAMGLVFTTLLSLIPLLAFSFAILKVFGAHRDLEPVIYEFFRPIGRDATALTGRVMEFADNVSSGIVGSVGFALLLWTLIGTIQKVEDSFNFVWRVERARGFARRIAEYLSLLIVGRCCWSGFSVSRTRRSRAALPSRRQTCRCCIGHSTSCSSSRPTSWSPRSSPRLYKLVPNTPVRILPALLGGLVAGIIWATVGKIFTEMVVYTTRLTIVYAGFAIIVAALLWTYFGWLILLVGAQLSFYIQNPSYLRLGLVDLRLSSEELEAIALKVMFLVGRSHTRGEIEWSANSLARELGLPGIAVSQLVHALEQRQLLTATEKDRLVPARDIGHIRLQEIVAVARNQRSGHTAPRQLSLPPVDRLTEALEASWRDSCGERTLRDLIDEAA